MQSGQPTFVGNGYDSVRLITRPNSCIKGKVVTHDSYRVKASLDKVDDWNGFQANMDFSIPGSLYLKSGSDLAKFVFKARQSSTSLSFVFHNRIIVKDQSIQSPKMTPQSHDMGVCGDQYVSHVEFGGDLKVGFKFRFNKTKYKSEFEMGSAFKNLLGIVTHIKSLPKSLKKQGSIEIFYTQSGGDIQSINKIFDSGDLIDCSLEKFEKCQKIIEDMWNYSQNEFSSAVANSHIQAIAYRTRDYPHGKRIIESRRVKRERRKVIRELERHIYDLDIVNQARRIEGSRKNCDRRCLALLSSTISANISALKDSLKISFADSRRFLKEAILENTSLFEYTVPKTPRSFSLEQQFLKLTTIALAVTVPLMGFIFKLKSPKKRSKAFVV